MVDNAATFDCMTSTIADTGTIHWPEAERLGLDISLVWVTPEVAAEFLTHNTRNRRPNFINIRRYAEAMKMGRWNMDGAPIRFGEDGVLLDGQNRCHAIIESGVSGWFLIVRGLASATQADMDTGGRRSLGQQLTIMGVPNATSKAAAVEAWLRWTQGGGVYPQSNSMYVPVPISEKIAIYQSMEWLEEDFSWIRQISTKTRLTSGPAAVLWRIFSEIDREDAEVFFEAMFTDVGHPSGSPVLALRRSLDRFDFPGQGFAQHSMVALTIKAWNIFRERGMAAGVSFIRYSPGGANPEAFPVAR